MATNILIVEDEPNLGTTLNEYLTGIGHDCALATTVAEAKTSFANKKPTIVLMDIGLPDGNGIELARELKWKDDFVLLFLSALNDPETKLEGLELGAEDYITKPFALKELTLRLERILKYHKTSQDEHVFGRLKFWPKRYMVQDANEMEIPLSQKECQILKILIEKKAQVVSRDEIIDKVWGEDQYPSHRTVDNYIVKLRKWTETDETGKLQIQSVRGIGYKLEEL
jgi:two-component system alkaline phosphatase synthesis response regulator PhoP